MPEITLENAVKYTMQALPDAQKNGAMGSFWGEYSRTSYLAPRGTRQREHDLRRLSRHDDNTTVISALINVVKIISSTPWEIIGPEKLDKDSFKYYQMMAKSAKVPQSAMGDHPDIAYYQAVFRNGDFERGWTSLIEKLGFDYLRQDAGAFVEIIAPGDPSSAPTGPVSGLSILDSVRCWPTGDPEFPVVYWNRKGEYHLIHHTRIIQFQDMPDSDEMIPGYGMCALSRAVAISQREILMSRYIASQLDDKPPPGILTASGMLEAQRNKALELYRKDQKSTDQTPDWGRLMWIFSIEATSPIKLDMLQFSKPPEKFDWKIYTELDIDLLALAIGVDRQDLWQLTGGNIGSKGQSETMAQKARGKTIGLLRSEIERKFNDLLPDEYEFKWKYKDTQEELERAQIAQTWTAVTASMMAVASPDEMRKLLASQSEEIKDAFSDENGKLLSVGDADVQTAQQIADDTAAAHALELATTAPPVDPNKQPGAPANSGGTGKPVPKRPNVGRGNVSATQKAIQSTTLDFENDFADLVKARIEGTITGQRFGVLARAQLKKYGLQAFRDGLEDGGVQTTDDLGAPIPLESDEQVSYTTWLLEQSAYVTAFGKTLTKGNTPDPDSKASLWANNSLRPVYNDGVMYADKNGMYEFVLGNTEEHCADCVRLNGQVHRYRNWDSRDLVPPTRKTECGGWLCKCKLTKTTQPISGGY